MGASVPAPSSRTLQERRLSYPPRLADSKAVFKAVLCDAVVWFLRGVQRKTGVQPMPDARAFGFIFHGAFAPMWAVIPPRCRSASPGQFNVAPGRCPVKYQPGVRAGL